MNCNRLAPVYRIFEYGAFGSRLQRHRTHFLPALSQARRALILGDGDGRFVVRLLQENPELSADYIDRSEGMRQQTYRRLAKAGPDVISRCHLLAGDALAIAFPSDSYDLVATHFFLDCFADAELHCLIERIVRHFEKDGLWIVSDFHQPAAGWRAIHARLWLSLMYSFFALLTGLKIRRLPDYRTILKQHGLYLSQEMQSLGQLVCSQLWRREPDEARPGDSFQAHGAVACH